MTTQREKDEQFAVTKYDWRACEARSPKELFADGATYGRKDAAKRLRALLIPALTTAKLHKWEVLELVQGLIQGLESDE